MQRSGELVLHYQRVEIAMCDIERGNFDAADEARGSNAASSRRDGKSFIVHEVEIDVMADIFHGWLTVFSWRVAKNHVEIAGVVSVVVVVIAKTHDYFLS